MVELSAAVCNESRFRNANPGYVLGMSLVYVGMTGPDPDVRFGKLKAGGIQSNRFVRDFGLRLVPGLYEAFNPMPYDGARDMEVELAIQDGALLVSDDANGTIFRVTRK